MNEKKKISAHTILFIVSVLFQVGFVVKVIADAVTYNTTLNSAPFWMFILVDFLEYMLPAAIFFVIGLVVKKKKCR